MSKIFNLEEYDTIVINDLSLNSSLFSNFQLGIPIGTIIPWQDINTIPDGWKLCDGNGTYTDISGITRQIPDLRSKFIIGHDTRDTSFNIDTSGSSYVYRESDSDPDKPRSVFATADTNDDPLNSSDLYTNIYYSLAYIIRVSNPNTTTDTAGDKIIHRNLICNRDVSLNENLNMDGNLISNGYISSERFDIPSGQNTYFRINGTNEMTLSSSGNLTLKGTSSGLILQVGSENAGIFQFYTDSTASEGSSKFYYLRFKQTSNLGWDIGHQHGTGNDLLHFRYNNVSKGYIDINHNNARMNPIYNFTGQHRTFIQNISASQTEDYVGLIVSANQDTYIDMSTQKTPQYGKSAITINECLPKVSLSVKDNDKSVFGVISGKEDISEQGDRIESYGNFKSVFEITYGDKRTYINSIGEGAIWVSNKNGNLESGDYITSSSIPGYGQKQEHDSLKNYTVAKMTMDCDFQPSLQYIKEIKTANINFTSIDSNNSYYHATTNELIYTKSFDNENGQSIDEYKNPKYNLTMDTSNNLVSVTQNILDSNGEIQWEDTTEQEYAYEIRYVDSSGNVITKEQHDSTISNGGSAYIAAFVGCTYHCG